MLLKLSLLWINFQFCKRSKVYEAQENRWITYGQQESKAAEGYNKNINEKMYIDEISSFLELTHNDTLDNVLKHVYHTLIRFIKHADKVIVSDALITDAVFELLKHRSDDKK